jgi:flagellar hook-basal body complex protein FliE
MVENRIDSHALPSLPGLPPAGGEGRAAGRGAPAGGPGFEAFLRESIASADQLQHDAAAAVESLSAGETDRVTEVMTAVEKADIAFRTLMQVRNKLVDAYEELLRLRL